MRNSSLLAIILVVVGIGSLLGAFLYGYSLRSNQQAAWQQSQPPSSQQYSMGQPVTIEQAIQTMRNIPSYARVISSNNTIVFESRQFNVFVLALMLDTAVNITGRQPPSYATGDVFVIYGLINPTITVRSGASVQFTVVNLDDDMYHNLVVSTSGPPYGYMSMQGMMSGDWMPYLPAADYSQGTAHEYSYTLTLNQPGTLWYICTYPDHALSGMYGKIIVTG